MANSEFNIKNENYPNLDYCVNCNNYDIENNSCGAMFGPEITVAGKGKEYCMRYDRNIEDGE